MCDVADTISAMSRFALVFSLLWSVALVVSAPAVAASRSPARAVEYSVGSIDMRMTSAERRFFADVVHATLNDPRGWSLNGAVRFRPRRSGGQFQVTLAPASTVARFGGCSWAWSCRAGWYVLLNAMRWNGASPIFAGPANLHAYRWLMINHEVGHALGFGHSSCSRAGADANVMQQQSINLGGCRPNPWPVASERAALARRLGIRVERRPMWLVPGRAASGIHVGMTRRMVRARIGSPQSTKRVGAIVVERFQRVRLAVEFHGDHVVAVTSRAAQDRTRTGAGVGGRALQIRRLAGIACSRADAAGTTWCVLGRDTRVGDRTTTFVLHGGKVVAVRVARRTTSRA